MRSSVLRFLVVLVFASGLLSACGGSARKRAGDLPESDFIVPAAKPGLHLRVAFDDDPSDMIGRFLPNGLQLGEIDESQGMQTRCSRYISYKEVKAGGTYIEYFNASRGLKASLGVEVPGAPGGGAISGGTSDSAALRVRYTLAKKMRAVVKDPDALDRCCEAAPDQCTDFYIGEFLSGTGRVFQAVGAEDELKAGGSYKAVSAEVEYQDSVAWKRVNEFEGVYFAFKTQRHQTASTGLCQSDWTSQIPSSLDGTYFVGVSAPTPNESQAWDLALRNARVQVVKYLGEYLTSEMATRSSALEGYLEDEALVTSAAQGIAAHVKDKCRATIEKTATPRGNRYVARVLVFFPKAVEETAKKETLQGIAAALRKEGRPDPALEEASGK